MFSRGFKMLRWNKVEYFYVFGTSGSYCVRNGVCYVKFASF